MNKKSPWAWFLVVALVGTAAFSTSSCKREATRIAGRAPAAAPTSTGSPAATAMARTDCPAPDLTGPPNGAKVIGNELIEFACAWGSALEEGERFGLRMWRSEEPDDSIVISYECSFFLDAPPDGWGGYSWQIVIARIDEDGNEIVLCASPVSSLLWSDVAVSKPAHTPTSTLTLTPTHTPLPTSTPTPTPTHTPLLTNTPTPTPTHTPLPTSTPIPTPTHAPLPTNTPMPTIVPTLVPGPPILTAPPNGLAPELPFGKEVGFKWTWDGDLGKYGVYSVRVWPIGELDSICHHPRTTETSYTFSPAKCPEVYAFCWQVQPVKPNVDSPTGWDTLSPPSEVWCFAIARPEERPGR